MAGPLILFLPTSIASFSLLGPIQSGVQNTWVQYLFMLPSFPYEVIVCGLFEPENTYFQVQTWICWIALVLQPIVYYLIHTYIEAIIPNAYGVTKSCCFCLRRNRANEIKKIQI